MEDYSESNSIVKYYPENLILSVEKSVESSNKIDLQ